MIEINQESRVSTILQIMKDVKESSLSVNKYFKEKNLPFGQAQYYLYRKAIEKMGIEGLYDQRSKGNNLKFTDEMKSFVKGLLKHNRSLTSTEVQNAIKNEFKTAISNTVINDFRREHDLIWSVYASENESGASEMVVALALNSGLIDAITDSIYWCAQKKKESDVFKESELIQKDHQDLRSKGRFTSEYNNQSQVRESRFKPLE